MSAHTAHSLKLRYALVGNGKLPLYSTDLLDPPPTDPNVDPTGDDALPYSNPRMGSS
jgi:hypothetical protein